MHVSVAASKGFHKRFRPVNHSVRLPLMRARHSRKLYCNSWILSKSMLETHGFSDEAYFSMDCFINKQNWRIWVTKSLHVAEPSSLLRPKVMVWATISFKGLIGSFFRRQTITEEQYLNILRESVYIYKMPWRPFACLVVYIRRCSPHGATDVFKILYDHFGIRVSAMNYSKHSGSGMDWPPYSLDLALWDFFLWNVLKRPGVLPKFSNYCLGETANLFSM